MTRIFIIGLFIAALITGCKVDDGNNNNYSKNENLPQLRAEWEREYDAWKALDIRDYQFIYNAYGGRNGKITVKDGTACDSVKSGSPGDVFITIDDLFMTINGNFKEDEDNYHAPEHIKTSFSVDYHPEYHFPEGFSIIAYSGGDGGSWSFGVSDFCRIEDAEEEKWQPNKNTPELIAEWEREYDAWKSLNIQNYQYVHRKCYNSDMSVYWDYLSRITIKNGQYHETIGIKPDGFYGSTQTIGNIFNDIYDKFVEEMYPGWGYWPAIGMYFTVEYDPQYHFPVYFEYGHIIDMTDRTPPEPIHNRLKYSIRVSEFTPL
jgi:hypothetical protein